MVQLENGQKMLCMLATSCRVRENSTNIGFSVHNICYVSVACVRQSSEVNFFFLHAFCEGVNINKMGSKEREKGAKRP